MQSYVCVLFPFGVWGRMWNSIITLSSTLSTKKSTLNTNPASGVSAVVPFLNLVLFLVLMLISSVQHYDHLACKREFLGVLFCFNFLLVPWVGCSCELWHCGLRWRFFKHFAHKCNFLFVFYLDFTAHQDYFTNFEPSQSLGGAKTGGPWEKPSDHPQAKLGLSHMWPELGSNPQLWDDQRLRALKISGLNHSATGIAVNSFAFM